MNNLIINGIDYNKELNLLSEYLKESINSSIPIFIDVSKFPIETDVEEIIRLFRLTGKILYNIGETPIHFTEIETITFESWKKNFKEQTSRNAW